MDRAEYIAIDIGATWIRVALCGESGEIKKCVKIGTLKKGSRQQFLERIYDAVKYLQASNIVAVGIGSIGPIDMKKGFILNSPNIEIHNIPVVSYLQDMLNVPVLMVNDCTAAVIGEKYFGAGKGHSNIVYITLSSGIGGGAIVDNKVLFGKDGNAVEIGHLVVDYEGRLRCGCGGYGHWEAYTSGSNIHRFVGLLIDTIYGDEKFKNSMLSEYADKYGVDYKILVECAEKEDDLSREILKHIAIINAVGFASVTNAFDPEVISVGGSIVLRNPRYLVFDPILSYVEKYIINRMPKITITPLGENVVLYGALALAMNPDLIPQNLKAGGG